MAITMLKSYLLKKIVDWDIIPSSTKWKKSVSGIGRIYADITEMLQAQYGLEGVKNLNEVMYTIGLNQADEIIKTLDLEKDLEGCAYTLLAMHRIFGIKSKIVQKDENRVIIHVTHCCWGRKIKGWTSHMCASIARYETGLVKGILPSATHNYTKMHTLGDNICEVIVSMEREK